MKRIHLGLFFLVVVPSLATAADFELKNGDRVVWLGGTVVEREQRYGEWELMLTTRFADRNITFRNLGWSGDTVHGEARLAFDVNNLAIGLKRMADLTLAEKPTVVFICYGANESFDGKEGLPKFEQGMQKLLDALAPAEARLVLISPMPQQSKILSAEVVKTHNENLALYRDAIKSIAQKRQLHFADLFAELGEGRKPLDESCTDNGVHLTAEGYAKTADSLRQALGIAPAPMKLTSDIVEKLRERIVEKNQLYFYRWRPQNETYLFGFRKREQGRNAKEVAEFDPLIVVKEKEIAKLRGANME